MGLPAAVPRSALILVGLFAGIWVDRFRQRSVMIGADLGRALLLGSIPIAVLMHNLSIGLLCAMAFLVGGLTFCPDQE